MNAEQTLGNNLLTGDTSSLPSWAKTYLNNGTTMGAESAVGRGVGAFSGNAISGVNQYQGNNALNLINLGAQFSNTASNQAGNIVNSNMYRNDPMNGLMSTNQFMQAGMFNTDIQNKQAEANTAVNNYNSNNSPLGNMTRTGLQMISSLVGSYFGDSSLGDSFSTSGNGANGPIQGSSSGGKSGGGMGGMGSIMGML